MPFDPALGWVYASILLSLRISPAFIFAPPFSLLRLPVLFRALLGLGLAACVVGTHPELQTINGQGLDGLALAAAHELLLGTITAVAFQLAFAALYLAGRTVDVQAGFGFALLADPNSGAQTPLIGTLYAYLAGAVFVGMDGHLDLLRAVSASLTVAPLGDGAPSVAIGRLLEFTSEAFVTGFGVAGGLILTMFLCDLAIAMLSRTAPQMNVLVFGFQVKTMVLLLVLPITLGASAAVMVRLLRYTLETLPPLLHP